MADNSSNFWYGKNVLITGGDGFVAANLAADLIKRDANVAITVRHQRPVSTLKLLGLSDVSPDMEFSDLSDFISVQKLCNRHQIDTIFHLAASAIVSDASRSPISTFPTNLISTLNILETARINNIPRVVVASSDKSYGDHADADDPERLPYRENQALRGLDVYSSSKVCTDMMCQTYAFQFHLPVIVVRSCNIYGPGDLNFTRLIPRTILRLFSELKPVINDGNARVLREYVYIDDLVAAYQFLAENMETHYKDRMPRSGRTTYGWSAYNVGSYAPRGSFHPEDCPNIRSVTQVIQDLTRLMKKDHLQPTIIPKDVTFVEIPDQYLDSSKIMNLGYKTKVQFNEGLQKSIEWYKGNSDYLRKLGDNYLK
jgi:CDP-glucose 4,6-dehydratase